MAAELNLAHRVVHGEGCWDSLPALVQEAGWRRILCCADPFFSNDDQWTTQLVKNCADRDVVLQIVTASSTEPTIEDCEFLIASNPSSERYDAVLGVGGGSSLDLGKALAARLMNDQPVQKLAARDCSFQSLPFIAVPTTAGSGSECTDGSVLIATASQQKTVLASTALVPRLTLLDPLLTMSCPSQVSGLAAIDALCHAIESLTASNWEANRGKGRTLITIGLAKSALMLLIPSAVEFAKGDRRSSTRAKLLYGSHLAGMAFATSGLHVVHALAYALQEKTHLAHGDCLACFLPGLGRANPPIRAEEFAWLHSLLADASLGSGGCAEQLETLIEMLGITASIPHTVNKDELARCAIANNRLSANAPGDGAALIHAIVKAQSCVKEGVDI